MTKNTAAQGNSPKAAGDELPTIHSMSEEHRASSRDPVALRFTLPDGSPAVTRDISPHGMYFFVPAGFVLEHWLSIEYEIPETGLRFAADGEVVRTEPGPDGTTGVAVLWRSPRLSIAD